jgi:hypothetical protein
MIKVEARAPYSASYQLTERGQKWIDMILATPMPVNRWIDPREEATRP